MIAIGINQRLPLTLYLAVLVAGALTVFAFAPFNFYPLAWITPAVLFYALTKATSKKQYTMLGWIYGIGLFGTGASWPFYSLYFYANAPLPLAMLSTALFVVFVAFFSIGLFGLLASLFCRQILFTRILLVYPLAWVLLEWFRGWFLTGFPWLYLGSSQIDTLLANYAPIVGVLGVSLASVLVSAALLCFLIGNSSAKTVSIKNPEPMSSTVSNKAQVEEVFGSSIRVLAALIIVFIIMLAYAIKDINWTQKKDQPFSVSVLQSNITQKQKLNPDNLLPMLDIYADMTDQSFTSDLIVWPETGLFDAFSNHMESYILPLQKRLAGTGKTILLGGFFINENQGVENSVLALSADNREIYSKRHLVPFGEYIPLLDYIRWLGEWIQLPYSNIDAGINDGTLNVNGQIAQMSICYEDAFGREIIESLPRASFLVNVTHDGWFTGSLEPQQHMQIARMRSIETGRYMVRATTTGPAGIINEKGQVIATAPINTRSMISGEVQPYSGSTPYVRWGDTLLVSILTITLGVLWLFQFISTRNRLHGKR